jgi:hypothetical protein
MDDIETGEQRVKRLSETQQGYWVIVRHEIGMDEYLYSSAMSGNSGWTTDRTAAAKFPSQLLASREAANLTVHNWKVVQFVG